MMQFFDYRITFDIPALFGSVVIVFAVGSLIGFYRGYKTGRKLDSAHFEFDNTQTNQP